MCVKKEVKMPVTNCTSVCHLNVPVLDGHDEEVDKPGEGVLVHGVDVGQVCQGEEEDGGVACNGAVTHAGRLNLLLCFLRHLSAHATQS